jgi:uncharacterized protein YndB with AHSA1/START domain
MTVTAVQRILAELTLVLTAEFEAPPERVWQLWADPRQLERWWGPPTYPATFTAHDLRPGGRMAYHMTGPTGDQPRGWWEVVEAEPPHRLVFHDGFAHDDGSPNGQLPVTTASVRIEPLDGGRSRMTLESVFPSAAAMEQVLAMGAEEGLTEAIGQMYALLGENAVLRP